MIDLEALNKAIRLTQNGKFSEAEELYKELIASNPDDSILLSAFGLFYVNLKEYAKAQKYLEKACSISKSLGTLSSLGFAYYEQKDFINSAKVLEECLEYGCNQDILNRLILSFFNISNFSKAIYYSTLMHQKYPEDTNALSHLVKSLTYSGKLHEAEELCLESLDKYKESASLWFHLGFLKELIYNNNEDALKCYEEALKLGSKEAYYNIAVSYQKQRKFDMAEENYRQMLKFFPNHRETILALGMCKLTQRKFREGYELLFLKNRSKHDVKTLNPWSPEKAFEKELVVICDQGYGDQIQFIRYIPLLKEKVDKIHVASNKKLINLFRRNYPEINFINYEDINPNMQSLRLTDIAFALDKDFEQIPSSSGYLAAEKFDIVSDKLKVGLCWEAGGTGIRTMINRTIDIKKLESFFDLNEVQFYSFQVKDTFDGNNKYPQMINLAKDFKDFEDTAKAMLAMDVIITVDTSVAHLAGALGVKTFLMLPFSSDWRWFDDIKTTPWYDSIEIFKQQNPSSWMESIEEIKCKLKKYCL